MTILGRCTSSMITRTSRMDASWRVGVWPRSLFTTLSARIPHLHPKKAPQGNRNLSDIEPLSPIPLRPLHSNSLAQYISYTGGMCTWMLRSELHHQQRCTSMRLKNRPVRSKRRDPANFRVQQICRACACNAIIPNKLAGSFYEELHQCRQQM